MKLAILALALSLTVGVTLAQEAAPTPEPEADLVTVTVPGFGYQLDGNEPVQFCVIETKVNTQGSWIIVAGFVRNETGEFVHVGNFPTRATGALADPFVDLCLPLDSD